MLTINVEAIDASFLPPLLEKVCYHFGCLPNAWVSFSSKHYESFRSTYTDGPWT